MYFTVGWPRILRIPESDPQSPVVQILANRDKILFAVLTHSSLSIWTSKPCLPVVCHQRSITSIKKLGHNASLIWKPDSTALIVVTAGGYLLFYGVSSDISKTLYEQIDPENVKLRRESDELFLKEPIPVISIELVQEIAVKGQVGSIGLFRDELMVSTDENHILRYRWDGTINRDFCIDLRRIPFSLDQQASRAVPIQDPNVYPIDFHYSPLIGGFTLVLSDGRAAFLTASTKVYDPNSVQGIWAPGLDDATCSSVNHKYRLMSFGRKNAETAVYGVDEQSGGLNNLFNLKPSSRDFPGSPGAVKCLAWTPDGCAIATSWERGGFGLWSVFGSLLTCSWSWTCDISPFAQKVVKSLDWAAEGYQLWLAVEPPLTIPKENNHQLHFDSDLKNNINSNSNTTINGDDVNVSAYNNNNNKSEENGNGVGEGSVDSPLLINKKPSGAFGLISFIKSVLTVNPAMSQVEHLYLQGEDRLLINFSTDPHDYSQETMCNSINTPTPNNTSTNSTSASVTENSKESTSTPEQIKGTSNGNSKFSSHSKSNNYGTGASAAASINSSSSSSSYSPSNEVKTPFGNSKNWLVVTYPHTYLSANWPIRFTAMDPDGLFIAVSGRYGFAQYSVVERKWKLFGNEAQERDFVVTGGMMWWEKYLVVAVYDIPKDRDELRFYPRDSKLDNKNALIKRLPSQILLLSLDRDKLLIFSADSTLAICQIRAEELKSMENLTSSNNSTIEPCDILQTIDLSGICVHPACVISVYLTTLKASLSNSAADQQHSVVINVSGKLMILHHEFLNQENSGNAPQYITPTVLASCVELVWLPRAISNVANNHNPFLSESLWIYCGQEMRVWLPLKGDKSQLSIHTFISNRIMLGFNVSIYPLTILFEKAIILGTENDSLSYTSTTLPTTPNPEAKNFYGTPNALFPFCILQRTSQVYLHQILRQLIRKNLGYYAWEIARSCSKLPYFPHSLELLLHEVLEEEATSKEPIPDALLPSVIEFVREFPVYLRAVGQCARKTELALWTYLFNFAGRPRALFDECLQSGQLDIAATYLLIIQNLESSSVSRKFANQLLEKAHEARKWDLVKDLTRFLQAIDPNEVDTPRSSGVRLSLQTPPLSPSEYDISMVLGNFQVQSKPTRYPELLFKVPRIRSMSTSVVPKFPDGHRELNRTMSDTHRNSVSVFPVNNISPNSNSNSTPGKVTSSSSSPPIVGVVTNLNSNPNSSQTSPSQPSPALSTGSSTLTSENSSVVANPAFDNLDPPSSSSPSTSAAGTENPKNMGLLMRL